jgi:two-component system CheB/CheR fusion protein
MAKKKTAAKSLKNRRRSTAKLEARSKAEINTSFFIVALGASAGGLKAFEQFFSNMPSNSGMAFVLVPHLDPGHVSMLPDLLRQYTRMRVVQVEDQMKVQVNRVHIIPPNKEMAIRNGILLLTNPADAHGPRLFIDPFFRSLAETQKEKAIGIIFSGNGMDGTLGLKAIKAEGGMAMAQEIASAEYDSMPKNAIETGIVDYILPPEKMPQQLIRYVEHAYSQQAPKAGSLEETQPEALQKILRLLRTQTGHDFSSYKKNTICRRIERRMNVHQIENAASYLRLLQQNSQEVAVLFKELLIGVTNFFRDREAFEKLKQKMGEWLADKPKDYRVRVWAPGCSSGEEVYSIAIILKECFGDLKRSYKAQIFGTDIDEDAIEAARAGYYPSSIASDVAPKRLKSFFVKEGDSYRIKKEIRKMVVFAVQDVIRHPPFTKLDLLSCRNLLIYLDPELQKKLLPLFHYALKPGGILFLGNSESVGNFIDLFSVLDKKSKLFKRKESAFSTEAVLQFPVDHTRQETGTFSTRQDVKGGRALFIPALAEKTLLETYAPACVLITSNGEILYTHGRTGKYLELAQGQARLNVLEMARGGLKHELAALIRKVRTGKKQTSLEGLPLRSYGRSRSVTLRVTPIRGVEGIGHLMLVVFEEAPQPRKAQRSKAKALLGAQARRRVADLEQELKYTEEHLQTTVEELETSNEELKSSNEELQSTNEELQSTNEELETSKEELQSLNEELVTVNAELQGKIDDLSRANEDMKNILDSTKMAIIFLDDQLRVKRFSSEATKLISLIPTDIGRPVSHIRCLFEQESLAGDAQQVVNTLVPQEKEVGPWDGRWYLKRVIPYRTTDNVIAGVVFMFTDITERKKAEMVIEDARDLAEGIFETAHEPLAVLDADLKVLSANPSFYRLFQVEPDKTEGKSILELGSGQWRNEELKGLLEKIMPENRAVTNFEIQMDLANIGAKRLLLNARRIQRHGLGAETILLAINDTADGTQAP